VGLLLQNNYLLLEKVVDSSSPFVSEGSTSNKYKLVHWDNEAYGKGGHVYLRSTLGPIDIDGTEYELAEDTEVVAYVA
jgi:hypothetical protein